MNSDKVNLFITIALGAVLWLTPQSAVAYIGLCCGKCGGNMPMNIPGAGVPETNEFRFKLSPMFMRMDGLRDGTDGVGSGSLLGSPAKGKFMAVQENMDMLMGNAAVGYSFTDDFFAGLMFMYRDNSMDMKFSKMMKMKTGKNGFTMESSGMGDTMLMTKFRLYTDDPAIPTKQFSLFLGLNLPTGSINEKNSNHPMKARQKELLPYSMQLGSGTFDPAVGLVYQASKSPWWWGANFIYTARFYDNSHDYRLGDEAALDIYAMYQLRYNLVIQAQINAKAWGEIQGEMDVSKTGESGHAVQGDPATGFMTPLWDPANYGGNRLFTTIGLQWQPYPLHIIDLSVGLPLYQDLNGPQLEEDYRVMLTWYVEVPTRASVRYIGAKGHLGDSRLGF